MACDLTYLRSALHIRAVGQMIGCVVNRLNIDLNYSPDNVYLIGHSLGAHLVGFAGKSVTKPKGRQITALDPAGPPFFEYGDADKLALTDAQCVNVIHTNGASIIFPFYNG